VDLGTAFAVTTAMSFAAQLQSRAAHNVASRRRDLVGRKYSQYCCICSRDN